MKKFRFIGFEFQKGLGRIAIIACCILLCCTPVTAGAATPEEQDPLAAMQRVIDQQRAELNAQSEQLKSQQQRLDEQQEMLESMQSQLQKMADSSPTQEAEPTDSSTPTQKQEAPVGTLTELVAPKMADDSPTQDAEPTDSSTPTHIPGHVSDTTTLHDDFVVLDIRPLESDETGLFLQSHDGNEMIRFYGSVRALAVYDNRQNFHPYDLNIPQVPFGDADVRDWNSDWTINTTKLGFQVESANRFTALAEFDWKGESGDALRIRHMYLRTNHWLFGKHWAVINSLNFLPLAIDSHATSAHIGLRQPQIKYLGRSGTWTYQAALEYFQPKFDQPDFVDASKRNIIPNIAGNLSYVRPWGLVRVGAMLTSNKVRYTVGDSARTTSSDTGLALLAGIKASISERNTIKAHFQRTAGNSAYNADYGFGNYDMTFNPISGEFENLKAWGAQVALEHSWTPSLTTSIGGGYMSMDTRDFQPGDFFDHGYKALVNLFYRPGGWLKGLTVAGEVEFAGQTTLDGSSGDTTRISVAVFYDF